MGSGRPHRLDDPEFAKEVAQAFVDGYSRTDMCEMFDVKDPSTITRWRRDPRVKAISMKLVEDRVVQISRKVDSQIEARLANAENMSLKELLSIRKEFLGGSLREQTEKADDKAVNEAMKAVENNPDLVKELEKMLTDGGSK